MRTSDPLCKGVHTAIHVLIQQAVYLHYAVQLTRALYQKAMHFETKYSTVYV